MCKKRHNKGKQSTYFQKGHRNNAGKCYQTAYIFGMIYGGGRVPLTPVLTVNILSYQQ